MPLAYATARDNEPLRDFLDVWIELKKQDRTITSLYDEWLLGQNAVPQVPRWSVIRDLLHWSSERSSGSSIEEEHER